MQTPPLDDVGSEKRCTARTARAMRGVCQLSATLLREVSVGVWHENRSRNRTLVSLLGVHFAARERSRRIYHHSFWPGMPATLSLVAVKPILFQAGSTRPSLRPSVIAVPNCLPSLLPRIAEGRCNPAACPPHRGRQRGNNGTVVPAPRRCQTPCRSRIIGI